MQLKWDKPHTYTHTELYSMQRVSTKSTEWRRPIRCLKLRVSFRKSAANNRALLGKMTYEDKASYGSSPPCINKRTPTSTNKDTPECILYNEYLQNSVHACWNENKCIPVLSSQILGGVHISRPSPLHDRLLFLSVCVYVRVSCHAHSLLLPDAYAYVCVWFHAMVWVVTCMNMNIYANIYIYIHV